MKYKFTTIVQKEGKLYVATCVELGVASQGRTVRSAFKNLREAVSLYLEDSSDRIFKAVLRNKPIIRTLEVSHA